jgi:glycosyltransferase involved in cell wall biosynthesis
MFSHKKNEILWIAWEKQRRSTTLANLLGADLYQLESRKNILFRYLSLSIKTVKILQKKKYDFIFVQNPSLILSLLIVCIKRFFKNPTIVVDTHTFYLKLNRFNSLILKTIQKLIFENSDLVILTNIDLKKRYKKFFPKGKYFILPDKFPDFKKEKTKLSERINILYICTYAQDEPFMEVFKAARKTQNVTIYVTGNSKKMTKYQIESVPDNVILTGFLADEEYIKYLNSVDMVMVLSDMEDCMLCGAYESVSVGKPLILSEKKVLVEYFNYGVMHTENKAEKITQAINDALKQKETLSSEILILKQRRTLEWKKQWRNLISEIRTGS